MTLNNATQLLLLLLLLLITALLAATSTTSTCAETESRDNNIQRSEFPDGFLFGTSTSAYQVEGGYLEDGKSLSNWDVFCHKQGNIINQENGDISTDHYHRYLEDIDIMHSLGVNAYRFSISWSRILPKGIFGKINSAGVAFYNSIIDNLLLKGIEPFATIHHYDYPQELEDRYGGWLSPLMQEDFVHFAEICFRSFGDRVKYWTTINEPNIFSESAYEFGEYPPAHCSSPFGNCSQGNSDTEPLIAVHNMLLAHSKAVKRYRDNFQPRQGGSIGIAASAFMYEPLTDSKLDREAASRALAFSIAWIFDPVIYGDYPAEMHHFHGSELPLFSAEEKEFLGGSADFIGINHYSTKYTKDCIYSSCSPGADHAIRGFTDTTGERDGIAIGEPTGVPTFYIVPRGMEEIVIYLKKRYHNIPIFVTENGYAPPEQGDLQLGGSLLDAKRIEFYKAYLAALARAIRRGADVRGYFIWSLMDEFEWTFGYSKRFGLYYVNPQTKDRIPRLSASWYRHFLTNGSLGNKIGVGRSFKAEI